MQESRIPGSARGSNPSVPTVTLRDTRRSPRKLWDAGAHLPSSCRAAFLQSDGSCKRVLKR